MRRVRLGVLRIATALAARPNVLYLLSDDLRVDLGFYGQPALTPHLDALAADGLVFDRAYCQLSVCSPSRQSFLTGLRPDTNQVWNFIDVNPNATTVATPGWFRDHGYTSLGLGKTFHEDQGAWMADRFWNTSVLPYFPYEANACTTGGEGGGHCAEPDEDIYDYKLRNATLDALDVAFAHEPFFLAAGFRDPHLPWAAPQRMYDLYNESALAVAAHQTLPAGAPAIAWGNFAAVALANGTSFPYGPESPVPDWVARDQRRAYYAAVSYVDEHVGAILGKLGARYDDALIVAHSDHGYHLGEHGEWEKKSNFDLVVRVPLVIKPPKGAFPHMPRRTDALFELVDLFPTLASLAGLPPPDVDGDDQSPLFRGLPGGKAAAFHQYPACGATSVNESRAECNSVPKEEFTFMGYSVRTDAWRYTAWLPWNGTSLTADWDSAAGAAELYSHAGDAGFDLDRCENANVVFEEPLVAAELRAMARGFFG